MSNKQLGETLLGGSQGAKIQLPNQALEIVELYSRSNNSHELLCGNKSLVVMLPPPDDPEYQEAITIINNRNRPAVSGATTALYIRACGILRQEAVQTETPVAYSFSTKSPTMRAWAISLGRDIFNWQVIEDSCDAFEAKRIFEP